MFYLRDERQMPFVIGMTTLGILSLKPYFGAGGCCVPHANRSALLRLSR
jgi:hypothetical protein